MELDVIRKKIDEIDHKLLALMNERVQQGPTLGNTAQAATFTDIDVNENGVIDPGEFRAHQLQH